MSDTDGSSAIEVSRFLAIFFAAPGNLFKQADISLDGPRRELKPWLDLLHSGEPTVLPRLTRTDSQFKVEWYGVAASRPLLRRLTDDLLAFVGPSYSTFRGDLLRANPADPIETALLAFSGGQTGTGVIRFTAANDGTRKDDNRTLFDRLERMRRVWRMRPNRVLLPARTVDELLRDFTLALDAGRRGGAELLLDELRRRSLVDPLNLSFLRIRLLSRLGTASELLDDPGLADVLNTRRPAPVTAAIAAAAYRYFLARHEGSDSVELAIEAMSTLVLPRFRSLFAQGVGIREPDAIKAFALHDAHMLKHERSDYAQRRLDQWLAIPMPASDAEYVRAISAFAVPILDAVAPDLSDSTKSRLHIALESFHASDFATAFSVALEASDDDPFRRAALLCDTAFELDTLAARSAAAEAVAALPEATRSILLKRRTAREVIASLKRGFVDLVAPDESLEPVPVLLPQNWTDWLRALHDGRLNVGTLRAVARSGVDEWTVDDLLAKPDCPESFVEALKAEMPTESEFLLREQLPIMIGFFARDAAFPRRELVHVYGALFEWDSMLTEGGLDELAALLEVLSGMLRLGLSDAKYIAILEMLSELVARYNSAKRVSWMLDLLELLVVHPAGSVAQQSRRVELLHLIASLVVSHDQARRITSSQRRLLNALCVEIGEAEPLPLRDARDGDDVIPSDPLQSILSNRVLGIYTLSEQSAERAARLLLAAVPTCRVILNSDKVCTTRLRNLARTSDLIVIVAGRATHAATDCISQNARGSGLSQILYAAGNGTTGIITALEDAGAP